MAEVSILEKLTLLAWLAFLGLILSLVFNARWPTAVSLGFPSFCGLALWTIYVSFETKAVQQEKGRMYVTVILLAVAAFSAIWLSHVYQSFLH